MNKDGTLTLFAVGLVVLGLSITLFLVPNQTHSRAERRLLAQAPALTGEAVRSGKYMRELENYLLDQFPGREAFRGLNAVVRLDLLRQNEVGGLYRVDDGLYKLEPQINPAQVRHAAARMNWVTGQYLQESTVYYAVIPDKNVFVAAQNGYPVMDYNALLELLHGEVQGMEYIDLWDCLTVSDYYRTDTHWRQECLSRVAGRLAEAMETRLPPWEEYTAESLAPFAGVLQGQLALPAPAEALRYLTSDRIARAVVTSGETGSTLPVYDEALFFGMDGYDVFLSGAQAVLTITCDDGEGELIVFRESFGSSLAPLLLGGYQTITLIDLRYIHSALLADYVEFHGQDVLFLYSTSVLNNGMLLK